MKQPTQIHAISTLRISEAIPPFSHSQLANNNYHSYQYDNYLEALVPMVRLLRYVPITYWFPYFIGLWCRINNLVVTFVTLIKSIQVYNHQIFHTFFSFGTGGAAIP
jgi:hypothetical protein